MKRARRSLSGRASVATENGGNGKVTYHDYLIVGAGPGGVQMGYFLEQAGRDYLILEGGHAAAMFFSQKPRHRRLNSFNKRFNWFPEPEFNLRFDWNTLLTHDYSFPFRGSEEIYPLADAVVEYINQFVAKFELNVQYNTWIGRVSRDPETKHFILTTSTGDEYRSKVLIMATGPVKPNIPDFPGAEYMEGYESVDMDPKRYENKRIVILGHGNSAFETANQWAATAAMITILCRNRMLKHAWQTHYVGDVRAAGNCILDMSQLKLLHSVQGLTPTKITRQPDGSLRLYYVEEFPHWTNPGEASGWIPADHVIRCTGWRYLDADLFEPDVLPAPSDETDKYPLMSSTWESTTPDLYYAGAAMEGRNRRSPTGFIHGYRYTCRALFRTLENRYEGVPTPSEEFDLRDAADLMRLGEHIMERISLSSGLYECYGIMADALVFDPENKKARLVYELPADYILEHPEYTAGDKQIMLFTLEFGFDNFPNADLNSFVRRNDPERPGCVAFLHPVFRHYKGGVFVKGRNTRSSQVIRYDKPADVFEGDFGHEKPRNILLNFINEIVGVTSEAFPEEHFYNTEDRGGFTPWPPDQRKDGSWLPQCELQVGGQQVRNFDHLEKMPEGVGVPIPPWVHTK
jgi:thioredoxin reductase